MKKKFATLIIKKILCNASDNNLEKITQDFMHKSKADFSPQALANKLSYNPQFRNILYWRLRFENKKVRMWLKILSRIYKPVESIEILVGDNNIGGGFSIPHRYCTINAKQIGDNCSIMQGVTIGAYGDGAPIIGNNVKIFPNAVVVGDITISDNVWIGAGTFVDFNVPSNSTVKLSNKAVIAKRI